MRLDAVEAPAVARWLRTHELTLGDLLRHPDDRDMTVAAVPVALIRGASGPVESAGAVVEAESPRPGRAHERYDADAAFVGAEAADPGSPEEAAARADGIPDPEIHFCPDPSTPLRVGDELVLLGRESGYHDLSDTLFRDAAVEYVATAREVPSTWLWRVLRHGRYPGGRAAPASGADAG